jgi:hypothetical protein
MNKYLLAACISLSLLASSYAQDKPKPDPPAPGTNVPQPPAKSPTTTPNPAQVPTAPKPPEQDKNIDDYLKDGYDKIPGVFHLFRKKKGTNDTVLLEVSDEEMKRLYLVQATASTGLSGTRVGIFQGAPLDDIPFRMRVTDDSRILFVQPNLDYRAPGDPAMQRTTQRGFPETILGSFEIKARQKDRNSYLIDVTPWFKSDIGEFSGGLGQGVGSYNIDPSYTYLDSIKNLPENLVIRTAFRLNRIGPVGGPRSLPFFVSYNVSILPETNYLPRIGDIRVGYFEVAFRDISDPSNYDQNVNYIKRWNIKKADPNAPLSPPVKPITFYLSNDIPEKYRDAVRQGILLHNKSFEAIGIKDAIVVEQMPDNADWDIADVRYNIIRWTQGNPFAIALFRANPVTGEILNAAINMDAVFATGGASEFDTFANPRKVPVTESGPLAHLQSLMQPQTPVSESDEVLNWLAAKHPNASGIQCTYPAEGAADANFGMLALSLMEPEGTFDKDAYIKQRITQVVCHEMGHCLGLRHNFVASTSYTMQQLSDPAFVKTHGVASTVMDYLPFNVSAINKKGVDYFSQTVGEYDMHAIQYGYTDFGAKTSKDELDRLKAIASEYNQPGKEYIGDGGADAYDPRVARFDLSADPLTYIEKKAQVSDALLRTLSTRLPKNGESYYEFTRQFYGLLNGYLGAVIYAPRYIGGINLSNNFKGDPGEKLPYEPVSGEQQKRALNLLNRYVFGPTAFNYPKANYLKFQPNPNNLGSEVSADARIYPIYDSLSDFQQRILVTLFIPSTQDRLVNNEFRSMDTLTLASLYRTVSSNIWSELTTGQEITGLRRDLQRTDLDLLIATALEKLPGVPRDGVTLAWEQLRTLRAQITTALPKAPGEYGKAHLTDCLQRINRAFNAQTLTSD